MKLTLTVAALAVAAIGADIGAQRGAPAFEAASVKVSTSNEPFVRMDTTPGRISARNITLRNLIGNAYSVRDAQVDTAAVPAWVSNDRFDVEATTRGAIPRQEAAQMMQTLLADRFKLAIRRETRDLPAYSLTPLRSDGTLGRAMKPGGDPECAPGKAAADPQDPATPRCGAIMFNPGRLTGRAVSWTQIVNALSGIPAVGRLVVDGGTKEGLFDFDVRWTPVTRLGGAGPADAPDSIFTALQEQLGLKLNPVQAPLPVIVVTAVQRPEPN